MRRELIATQVAEYREWYKGKKKGNEAHGRKIHSLGFRVRLLEDLIIEMSTPWYTKLWNRIKQ